MTDTDEKSRRLADWHELLSRPKMGASLDAWNRELRNEVDLIKAAGLLDTEEAHELRELADAAYSHYLEEAITQELNE
ncbi:hypothetical protein [Pseudomonas sp. G5(2012)]|uniref:hypothetical protein n=1 Tax=Pseudomonas sp. G5(2012) TaxID=1268068 RepID=UPI0005B35386|nr:hypothetical protein [Pseudomonas sp. G5(2012)]